MTAPANGEFATSPTLAGATSTVPSWRCAGRWGRRAAQEIADAIYPPVCVRCRAAVATRPALCASCWASVRFISAPLCDRLGLPMPPDLEALHTQAGVEEERAPSVLISPAAIVNSPPWRKARAVARFGGVARDLVHALKFGDRTDLALLLGQMMTTAGMELLAEADVIVPAPLHRRRLWSRRYNQAAALAAVISCHSGAPHWPMALTRIKRTAPQIGLSRNARARNVRGAFAVPPAWRTRLTGKSVLLIDDVMTTGATAAAATRALRRGGAAQVDVLTFAIAIQEGL